MCGKYDIGESRTKGVYIGRKSKHVLVASSLDHSHPSTLLVVVANGIVVCRRATDRWLCAGCERATR